MTKRRMVLEIRDAETGRCHGRRLVQLTFDDEMKDAEGIGFVARELWKDAKRAVGEKQDSKP